MKLEFDEKKVKKTIEKKLKKKYQKTLKSSKSINLMFKGAFNLINNYEFKAINELKLKNVLVNGKDEVSTSISFIKDYFKGKYRDVELETIILVGFGVFYLVEPIDILTDFLPLVGYSDDLAVLTMILTSCYDELEKYKQFASAKTVDEEDSNEIMIIDSNLMEFVNGLVIDKQLNDKLVEIEAGLSAEISSNIEQITKNNYAEIENDQLIVMDDAIDLKPQLILSDVNYLQIKLIDFLNYSHTDYSKIIYQQLLDTTEDTVVITSEMIKNQLLDKNYFDYRTCVETMMNNQTFDLLEKEYNIKKPYNKIIDSDKKQSITGSYYTVTYEKNPNISDYFENDFDWVLSDNENIDATTKLIKYQLSAQRQISKEHIDSIVNHVSSYYDIVSGIFAYEIETIKGIINIMIDNRNKSYVKVVANNDLIKEYIEVFDYLEKNLISIIENKIDNKKLEIKIPKKVGKFVLGNSKNK